MKVPGAAPFFIQMKRVHLIISGTVQGVFFRANTEKQANELGVTGWIKNIDSVVESVIEGEDSAVDKLVGWCKHGPAAAKVEDIKISEEEFKGEFEGFEIRY